VEDGRVPLYRAIRVCGLLGNDMVWWCDELQAGKDKDGCALMQDQVVYVAAAQVVMYTCIVG